MIVYSSSFAQLYNTWMSAQASLDITVVPLEHRAMVTRNIVLAETDDYIAFGGQNCAQCFLHFVERWNCGDVGRLG